MGGSKAEAKAAYFDRLKVLLENHKTVFVVTVDNVSSQQMHEIRQSLRGDGVVLMGKNTMVSYDQWSLVIIPLNFSCRSAERSRPILPTSQTTNVSSHMSEVESQRHLESLDPTDS